MGIWVMGSGSIFVTPKAQSSGIKTPSIPMFDLFPRP